MEKYSFTKLQGAGNDFILFDLDQHPHVAITSQSVSALCHRRFGIGADGVLLYSRIDEMTVAMRYLNADGSESGFCGNGARAVARYFFDEYAPLKRAVTIDFHGARYTAALQPDDSITMSFPTVDRIKRNIGVVLFGKQLSVDFVDTGAPHIVIDVDELTPLFEGEFSGLHDFPVTIYGKELRYHPAFQPEGVNANFVSVQPDGLQIRTYERGVEDETLACGTGSVASAIAMNMRGKSGSPVTLTTRSGEEFTVALSEDGSIMKDITLTGRASAVFTGVISI